MTPRKPDRFDQIAVDNIEWHTPAGTPMVSSYEVANLLRNEHAWVRQMVMGEAHRHTRATLFRDAIMKRLDQRRK